MGYQSESHIYDFKMVKDMSSLLLLKITPKTEEQKPKIKLQV